MIGLGFLERVLQKRHYHRVTLEETCTLQFRWELGQETFKSKFHMLIGSELF